MPRYDYRCPEGHVTERTVPLSEAPGPKRISCPADVPFPGCKKKHPCRRQAARVEVYTPAVSGDLPTRGGGF